MNGLVNLIVIGVLALVLLAAVGAAAVLWSKYLLYKASHPFTQSDMEATRKNSLKQSHVTVRGKVGEQFAPLFPEFFNQFNARDAKFLGQPVDYVVFDGLTAGVVSRVVFVEVKTGKAGLTQEQRLVREAVEQGRVTDFHAVATCVPASAAQTRLKKTMHLGLLNKDRSQPLAAVHALRNRLR